MAKKPILDDVSTGYASNTTLNSNFTKLNDALDNTISRDGSTPNAMEADFDMNSNDILNATEVRATRVYANGIELTPGGGGGGIAGITILEDGSTLPSLATGLNFTGAGITATGTGNTKTIDVPGGIQVDDEGSTQVAVATEVDFVGAGVVVDNPSTGRARVTIAGGGGGSGITIQDEGSTLTTLATTLDFVGSGVTASGTGASKTITIPGGASGTEHDYLTRAALDLDVAGLTNDDIVYVNGVAAVKDSSATGSLSALNDLGTDGIRLIGDTIDTRFWEVGTEQNADDTANLIAANAYAVAQHTASDGGVRFVVSGLVPLSGPVELGQTLEGFAIDLSGAKFNVISGGTMLTTDYALKIRGRATTKLLGFIDCNKLCNGYTFANNAGSNIIGGNVLHMKTIGYNMSGSNCNFINQFGNEWDNGDPEFDVDINFEADVIHVNSNDFTITSPVVGWALRPIYLGSGCNLVQLIQPHPYNGNPNVSGPRLHPRCIVSDAGGFVELSGIYLDNGYIEDRTGRIRIRGGVQFNNSAATLTAPYVRIQQGEVGNADETVVHGYQGSVGFYTGSWDDTNANKVTDIDADAMTGGVVGSQRYTVIRGRETTILRSGGVDEFVSKQGDATEVFERIVIPGTGEAVTEQITDGVKSISSGPNGAESSLAGELNLYEDGSSGVGIGSSHIRWASQGGSDLMDMIVRNNGVVVAGVDGVDGKDAGTCNRVYNVGSDTLLEVDNGGMQYISLSGAKTLTISNMANGDRFDLDVRNGNTHLLTLASASGTIRWEGGSAPGLYSSARTIIEVRVRGSDVFLRPTYY